MKPNKITEWQAISALKKLGIKEKEARGIIKMRLGSLRATQKRQAIDAIIAQIGEEEE